MISILITGHGKFSEGLYSSIDMLYGLDKYISYLNFERSENADDYKEKVKKELDAKLEISDAVLCLTDIQGGTPFKVCSELSLNLSEKVKVISGANIPMLLTACSEKDISSLNELLESTLSEGKQGINTFELNLNEQEDDLFDDGI